MSDTPQDNVTQPAPEPQIKQPDTAPEQKKPGRTLSVLAILLALGAAGGTGWLYLQTQVELTQLRQALSKQSATSQSIQKTQEQMRQMQADARTLAVRLAKTEALVHQSAGQYDTLNGMYNELTKNRTDWLLSEVEHTLEIASQQLQLTGDVASTITALETVDRRLAAFDRPQLINVKRAVVKDLEALKALPKLDAVGITVKLDRLQLGVDTLPLVVDAHRDPAKPSAPRKASQGSFWQRMMDDIGQSFGELVSIRRIDKPEALLLSPEQSFFLRENLKLRLLDARLALLQHDGATFNADIVAADNYVRRYFDSNAALTKTWLTTLTELKNTPVEQTVPSLSASLKAVQDAQNTVEPTP